MSYTYNIFNNILAVTNTGNTAGNNTTSAQINDSSTLATELFSAQKILNIETGLQSQITSNDGHIQTLQSKASKLNNSAEYTNDFLPSITSQFNLGNGGRLWNNAFINKMNVLSIEPTGNENVVFGIGANSGGLTNVAIGSNAGTGNSGQYNVMIGRGCKNGTGGSENIAIGDNASSINMTGAYNICIGSGSGSDNLTSNNECIYIGRSYNGTGITGDNMIAIGNAVTRRPNECVLGSSATTHIRPNADGHCDLGYYDGMNNSQFRNVYLSGGIYINNVLQNFGAGGASTWSKNYNVWEWMHDGVFFEPGKIGNVTKHNDMVYLHIPQFQVQTSATSTNYVYAEFAGWTAQQIANLKPANVTTSTSAYFNGTLTTGLVDYYYKKVKSVHCDSGVNRPEEILIEYHNGVLKLTLRILASTPLVNSLLSPSTIFTYNNSFTVIYPAENSNPID